ncbi:MAG: cyclic nucleotide-binding domain-containing protein [Gammaproteobacteria bacterium]|nr:cyclic nucleotide-binding domain-containing protein [Gammaproteobacteria bacterium]MCI0590368.1 cyclic nucleotide-binding domain-containing protein [Gammaproteobacteria bacterium]
MDKQLHLEIYEVLRASKAFQDFDDNALLDFVVNVKLNLLPALASLNSQQCEATERLSVVFKGRLIFAVKRVNAADEILYELGPGDVIGVVAPIGGFRNAPQLQASEETTIIGISWSTIDHHLEKFPGARKTLEDAVWRSSRRAQLAVHLNQFFGEIDSTALTDFESMIEWQSLSPGSMLFRQGDAADAVFFVLSGLLRVTMEENEQIERVINEVKAGETIGEMAFLTEARRSATVYAVRDTVLARLSYPSFDKLMDKYPIAMKHIARLVSKRLQRQTIRVDHGSPIAAIIGVVSSNPDCPLSDVTRHLVEALTSLGSTLHLAAGTVDRKFGRHAIAQVSEDDPSSLRLAQWLHQQEAHYQFVVYEADRTWSSWTQRAIRHVDQVVIFATANSDPSPGEIEEKMDALWTAGRAPQRSLVLIHPAGTSEPHGTSQWLEPRNIGRHFHVRAHSPADYARLARVLADRGIALVLGGGGARGLAHIGLLRAMEETGIPIDIVGGTSMGAILGGGIAMQFDSQKILATCKQHFSTLFDYTLPIASLIKGRKIRSVLESVFGERRIEDLWLPYFCVATNLTQADQVVHRRGPVVEAVRSSMSLPGILLPSYRDGDLLVDGSLVNNLPVDVMRSVFSGSTVIAVDVEPKTDLTVNAEFATEISGWALLMNRLNPFKKTVQIPSILNVLIRSATLASVYARNRLMEQAPPDLYMRLPVEAWGTLAFDAIDDIVACGYEAAFPRLQTWLPKLNGLPTSSGTA